MEYTLKENTKNEHKHTQTITRNNELNNHIHTKSN